MYTMHKNDVLRKRAQVQINKHFQWKTITTQERSDKRKPHSQCHVKVTSTCCCTARHAETCSAPVSLTEDARRMGGLCLTLQARPAADTWFTKTCPVFKYKNVISN